MNNRLKSILPTGDISAKDILPEIREAHAKADMIRARREYRKAKRKMKLATQNRRRLSCRS